MFEQLADGRTDLVIDYVLKGHQANETDAGGNSLLQWCAYYGDTSAVRFLLANGASLEELGDNKGLGGAAFHGHWQLCQFLLENGADANFADKSTAETPLHSALCKANRPVYDTIVDLLLAYGADPNRKTLESKPTGSFMRDVRTKGETALHRAAAFGTEKTIRLLLENDADKQITDSQGDTPLSWASYHLRPPSVLRLLCFGEHQIHPENHSDYDHGRGWMTLDPPCGKPHI